jgi:hypothetical protein
MTNKIFLRSDSLDPPPRRINPRARNRQLPENVIDQARSTEAIATLLDASEYSLLFKKINDQRIAIQGHIDQLIDEFDKDIAASKTETNTRKLAELHDRITSAFRRGYLDFCEFKRVERYIGMTPSDFAKYFSRC